MLRGFHPYRRHQRFRRRFRVHGRQGHRPDVDHQSRHHRHLELRHRNLDEVRHRCYRRRNLDVVRHPDEVRHLDDLHHRHRLDVDHPDAGPGVSQKRMGCCQLVLPLDVEFPYPGLPQMGCYPGVGCPLGLVLLVPPGPEPQPLELPAQLQPEP